MLGGRWGERGIGGGWGPPCPSGFPLLTRVFATLKAGMTGLEWAEPPDRPSYLNLSLNLEGSRPTRWTVLINLAVASGVQLNLST